MAGPWTVKIDVVYLAEKGANVTGTRTDPTNPTDVRTFTLPQVSFMPTAGETLAQIRAKVAAALRALYLADKARTDQSAVIAQQESLLATAVNALEV